MAHFYNILGSQTWMGTSEPDRFYLFNKDGNQNNMRVDVTFATFAWNTQLHLANGDVFQLTGVNVNGSQDIVIGDSKDAIYGSNRNDFVAYNNGMFQDGLGGFQLIQLMVLGAGDDIVDLTAHGPGGVAYAKDMKIYAGDGNDTLVGGAGGDVFYGEDGDDLIIGFAGADVIYGGSGNDRLYGDDFGADGSRSADTIYGQEGNDIIYGGGRNDKLDGGSGDDIIYGGEGADSLVGSSGNDILYGDDEGGPGAKDKLQGGAGDDQLYGGGAGDELYGGGGNDFLDGGEGNDYMGGDAGDDTILAGLGNDNINGGDDIDTVVFGGNRSDYQLQTNADGSVTLIDLRAGINDGIDTLRNVEFFQFADILVDASNLSTPPTIISNGGGAAAAIDFTENGTGAVAVVEATDPDVGQSLVYRILGGADAAFFTIDAVTGELHFNAPPDFENAVDADGDNQYEVIVGADDLAGGVGQQQLTVTILDLPDGNAPVIAGGRNVTVTLDENVSAVTTIAASDPDLDSVTYSIAGGADAARFTIDAATGVLSFVSAPDYEVPTDSNQDNVYSVIVAASDGTNAAWQTLTVSIANLNDTAPVLTAPGSGASAALSVAENGTAVTTVMATDADGSALTFLITGGADAALFQIDAATGALSFISAPDFEAPADAGFDNIYNVTVAASDGVAVTSRALSVSVTNVNDVAPVITSNGGGAVAAFSSPENQKLVTTVQASDVDSATLVYSIVGGADAASFRIDAATGALSFVTNPDFEHPLDAGADNTYDVIVAASDGLFSDQQAIAVTITDVNEIGVTTTGNGANEVFSPAASGKYQTTALNDTIFAKGGNDVIDGGAGADYMDGGAGNDTFYVDTWSDNGWDADDDQVIEAAAAGTDTVIASVSYRLTANVENLTLAGSEALSGWGNEIRNVMTGNSGNNLLDGAAGNDLIYGGDGDDTLIGGEGYDTLYGDAGNDWLQGGALDDILDGGTGADRMEGGTGADTYYVDAWSDDGNSANDDIVVELAGGGNDRVRATVSYALTDNVERLELLGSSAIDGTGNALANTIAGNSAANRLYGMAGNDTIDGGDGDDVIDGGNNKDTLIGGTGNDTLIGGLGPDVMTGGEGSDTFVFAFKDTSTGAGISDTITDFATGLDFIDIDIFAGAPANYAEADIGSSAYSDGLAAAQGLAGTPGATVFIAGSVDGWLFWDGNGDGVLDQAIILSGLNATSAFAASDIL